MKYMMLTYGTEDVYDLDSFTDEQRDWLRDIVSFMHELNADLTASGELVSAEGLDSPAKTRTVRPDGDTTIATDGPFAEAKEVLAGFWILEVASPERAEEIAARVVRHIHAPIELRPVGSAPEL